MVSEIIQKKGKIAGHSVQFLIHSNFYQTLIYVIDLKKLPESDFKLYKLSR
jgi:hypothetical protein